MSIFNLPFIFYYFPLLLMGYYFLALFKNRRFLQNTFLLICCMLLLFLLEPLFFPLLIILPPLNWFLGKRIKAALWVNGPVKKYLVAGYLINGGLFLVFQLLGTLVSYQVPLMGLEYTLLKDVMLPAGIAIFVLRAISYLKDIYAGEIDGDNRFREVILYLCFFPQMIVGPLQPYADFAPQLARKFDADLFFAGWNRFAVGLGKRILIANNLAVVSDTVFNLSATSDSTTQVPVSLAWLGLLAFSLQVYYDFSAYTDVAIGISNILGFRIPENFNYPYAADSITKFWDRWLITIKDWFDTYVSSPLNRRRYKSNDQLVVNTFIAFVAMGLWQKASVGILVWAFLQVMCIAIEKVVTYEERSIPRVVKHLYVIMIILFSMALYRQNNFYQTLLFLRNLFGQNNNGLASPLAFTFLKEYGVYFVLALLFALPIAPAIRKKVEASGQVIRRIAYGLYPVLLLGVAFLSLLYMARGLYVPTAYYGF